MGVWKGKYFEDYNVAEKYKQQAKEKGTQYLKI